MASAFDILGLIFGILGFLASIPVFLAIVLSQLPSQKLKELEDILVETETMWRSTLRDGLFYGTPFEEKTTQRLSSLRCQADDLRLQAHCATSIFQELTAMIAGLSSNISYVCTRVKRLRANISSTTAEERKRLQLEAKLEQMRRENAAQKHPETPTAADSRDFLDAECNKQYPYDDSRDADELSVASSYAVYDALEPDIISIPWTHQVVNHPYVDNALGTASAVCTDTFNDSAADAFPATCESASRLQFTGRAVACMVMNSTSGVVTPVVYDSVRMDSSNHREPVETCTALGPIVMDILNTSGRDGIIPLTDRAAVSDCSPMTSGSFTSVPVLSRSAKFHTTVNRTVRTSLHAARGEPVTRSSSTNAALLREFREVKQEVIARGLGFYTRALSIEPPRTISRKKRSSRRTSGGSVTAWNSPLADARAFSDEEACWEDCCEKEDTTCVGDRDISDLV